MDLPHVEGSGRDAMCARPDPGEAADLPGHRISYPRHQKVRADGPSGVGGRHQQVCESR